MILQEKPYCVNKKVIHMKRERKKHAARNPEENSKEYMDPVTSYGMQCFRHNMVHFIKVAMISPTNVSVWKDVALVMKPTVVQTQVHQRPRFGRLT